MQVLDSAPACSTDVHARRVEEKGLIKTISPSDAMFAGNYKHYFGVGQSALEFIAISLKAARKPVQDIKAVLDLPCGHGRVLRYLRMMFHDADITACDLDRDGVEFCAAVLGARPVYSSKSPDQIPLDRDSFDLIWVGSLFTHFDWWLWGNFLALFRTLLRPGGVLVFSTHGSHVYERMRREHVDYGLGESLSSVVLQEYEQCGFGYANYPGQDSYGISVTSSSWVCARIAQTQELRICHFSEKAWDNHHDCFACVRDPSWQRGYSGNGSHFRECPWIRLDRTIASASPSPASSSR